MQNAPSSAEKAEQILQKISRNFNQQNFSQENFIQEFIKFFEAKNYSFTKENELEKLDLIGKNLKEKFSNGFLLGEFEDLKIKVFCLQVNLQNSNNLKNQPSNSLQPDFETVLSEKSAKKDQYDLAKKLLNENLEDPAGIFIFHDQSGNFRFSLVCQEFHGVSKQKFTPFKRFTYFVSQDSKITNRTFISQVANANFSSVKKLKEAFLVKKVTEEFYSKIANWYFWAIENCEFPPAVAKEKNGKETAIIRLITRIIFIWFMRQRNLVNPKLFEEKELKKILKTLEPQEPNYYKAILQNLFFATLSVKKDERRFIADKTYKGINRDHGDQHVFRYQDLFQSQNPEETLKSLFNQTPFLNGGLFECLDKKDVEPTIYIDGFSKTQKNQPKIPNFLFFGDEENIDLNQQFGTKNKKYQVEGLIKILESFNFTIDENSIDDAEIALDPELLGQVFENLLAAFNPETSQTARKATGSYYTPREIVDFMVEESLKNYFFSQLPEFEKSQIEQLFLKNEKLQNHQENQEQKPKTNSEENPQENTQENTQENPFDPEQTKKIISLIEKIKIIDPAVGSGAFPMGVLNQIVALLKKLDPENELWKYAQIEATKAIQDSRPREEAKKAIDEFFKKSPDYSRKLYLIQKCIYGVDLQPIAVEITKLRFFISLLVDESNNSQSIQPLPNLDFKIMQGNSLIEDFNGVKLFDSTDLGDIFNFEKIKKLKELSEEFFNASNKDKKSDTKKQIEEMQWNLVEQRLKQVKTSDQIAQIKQVFTSNQKPFFLWQLNFPEVFEAQNGGGFDLVIGNPPYIQLQKFKNDELQKIYKNQNFKTHDANGDIYCLFYESGVNLLKNGGVLSFITSNKWMRAGYGENLRGFFASQNPLQLVDLGGGVFENATVDTNILLIQKNPNQNRLKALTLTKSNSAKTDEAQEKPQTLAQIFHSQAINLPNLTKDAWFIGNPQQQSLKVKIEKSGVALKDWNVKIYRGVLTGLNEAFIIDNQTKEKICQEHAKSAEILKPILRGRDIKKYGYEWAGLWVISSGFDVDVPKKYPAIFKHLLQFEEKAKKRDDQGKNWWNLRACAYYEEFEKEKVVYSEIVREPKFYLDLKGEFFCEATSFLISGEKLKFLCGVFNSKAFTYFFKSYYAGGGLGESGYRYKKQFLELVPIPQITSQNQPIILKIENLVEQILALKKGENLQLPNQPQPILPNQILPQNQLLHQNQLLRQSQLEAQIDALVYELYNLNESEIALIEQAENS